MLDNAIDHSEGTGVDIRWFLDAAAITFEIADDGIGVFRNMARERGLSSEYDAIEEISKGKQTTAPEKHSGLGIYFTSKMASRLVLTGGQWSWIVDNRIGDSAARWLELEQFGSVEIDFSGVDQVGQGFIDQLFRVWQNEHPATRLVPVNTTPVVEALLRLTRGS